MSPLTADAPFLSDRLNLAAESIASQTGGWLDKHPPSVALILGSGLGALADKALERFPDAPALPYAAVEGFPHQGQGVAGHKHRMVLWPLSEAENAPSVIAFQGRLHPYEGYSGLEATYPVWLAKALGAERLLVTNAAGGIGAHLAPGDLMLIRDQLNLTGLNPLRELAGLGPREALPFAIPEMPFIDMGRAYDPEFRQLIETVAEKQGTPLKKGVYAGLLGPTYETPAEVRMLQQLGGDAVGMSTVLEVVVARYLEMKTAGLSCITNFGAGLSANTLSHEDVLETSRQATSRFEALLTGVLRQLAQQPA